MPGPDLDLLIAAAWAAGDTVRPFFRNAARAWEKDGGAGPVTEADLAVNAVLERILREARPDYGWLSEESPPDDRRAHARRSFVIDPIDGTRAFIEGQDSFSHALCVVEDGQPIAAVVYLPIRDRLYAAQAGGPATRDGQPIAVSARAGVAGAQILTTKASLSAEHWRGDAPAFERVFCPSIAWRLCLVAEGRFDGILSFRPTWDWDIAAGSLIAAQAGARVTDARGQPLRFNGPAAQNDGIWAAPPALHGALRDRMAL
ncbi:3'(2'),5'-bisphosphate nucleotidase CysQ [Paracoccus sp. p3-h83]|uniref:3'(2'),5'-bisphosphate nucleotidase CysQ n=1 Tax=Paracoccus sp. p3-h83 TaxID=3342805 RepID=UPI0035B78EF3